MYNRTPYNKTTYNRTTSIVFEWLATANAETDTSATLKIIRYLDGSAAAVATASGVFVRVLLPSALAEAEAGSVGDYIRTLFFSALAEAVATASGTGVSTYGSVTMVIEGVNMVAGDELIIDTEHMTVSLCRLYRLPRRDGEPRPRGRVRCDRGHERKLCAGRSLRERDGQNLRRDKADDGYHGAEHYLY